MRKYLSVLLGVMLIFMFTALVYAETKINIGGDFRVRGILRNNYDFNSNVDDDKAYFDQRVRIRLTAKVGSAEIRTQFTLLEGKWGKDFPNEYVRFDTDTKSPDYAYLHIPIGGVTLDIGRQLANWGNKFMGWASPVNRIKLSYKMNTGTVVGVFYDKVKETLDPDGLGQGDADNYAAFAIGNVSGYKMGLLLIYRDDDTVGDSGHIIDFFFRGKAGAFGVAGEFAYKGGDLFEVQNDPQHGGFLAVSNAMGDLTISGAIAYANNGFTADESFTPTFLFGTTQPIALADFGAAADETTFAIVAGLDYKVSGNLGLGAKLAYADLNGMGVNGTDASVVEIDGSLKYKVAKNVTYDIGLALGIPNDMSAEDDTAFGMMHKIQVKF